MRIDLALPLAELDDARARTLSLVADLRDDELDVPLLETINPLLWELGHVAYFAEFWILRHLFGAAPLLTNADALYDSAKIAHNTRWSLPLPDREKTLAFMRTQLDEVRARAPQAQALERAPYFYRLALFHEDMHGEATIYTRQTLGYSNTLNRSPMAGERALPGDVRIPGGSYSIGARTSDEFVFDNEKWAHGVDLLPYEIARAPVTNREYADFVEDGGYRKSDLWSDEGWAWRTQAEATHPIYWDPLTSGRGTAAFRRRHFDRYIPLRDHEPVVHVNYFEAEAYCRWAGRRLPTEAEWETAATGGTYSRYPWGEEPPTLTHANLWGAGADVCEVSACAAGESPTGCRQMIGNVWEWTASVFEAYDGFSADPYAEYSQPWFGSHYVLRGGAWSTQPRLISTRWRNFYRPHRRDIITSFRTVKKKRRS